MDALIQEEFADQLQEEDEFEDPQEDEVRDNMIGDLRNHFESQTNTIESAKVKYNNILFESIKVLTQKFTLIIFIDIHPYTTNST